MVAATLTALMVTTSNPTAWIYGQAIIFNLTRMLNNLGLLKINLLDPQAQAFHQAQTTAIEQPGY